MGDEPYMLQMKLKDMPILVDANRIRSAKRAIRDYGVDTIILDDGFQQWKIKKDLEIVTVDATDPFGNWHLIPRGILREPLSSLKRADVFVLTKTNLNPEFTEIKDFLSAFNSQSLIVEAVHQPVGFYKIDNPDDLFPTDDLKGKTITLISGIAQPDSFKNLITGLRINVGLSFRFPDHYAYAQKDLDKIIQASKNKGIDIMVTTEKDAVRLNKLEVRSYKLEVFVLRIALKITKNEEGFHSRLLRIYSG
jgi:tetraacyldisaccharide 4'-kinase